MSFETVTGTHRYRLFARDQAFDVELFVLSDDPHDRERFARRRQATMLGRSVWVPGAEDVVIGKLRWARSKDLDDARNVIAVQTDQLD